MHTESTNFSTDERVVDASDSGGMEPDPSVDCTSSDESVTDRTAQFTALSGQVIRDGINLAALEGKISLQAFVHYAVSIAVTAFLAVFLWLFICGLGGVLLAAFINAYIGVAFFIAILLASIIFFLKRSKTMLSLMGFSRITTFIKAAGRLHFS